VDRETAAFYHAYVPSALKCKEFLAVKEDNVFHAYGKRPSAAFALAVAREWTSLR
jgi:hypothetical protein